VRPSSRLFTLTLRGTSTSRASGFGADGLRLVDGLADAYLSADFAGDVGADVVAAPVVFCHVFSFVFSLLQRQSSSIVKSPCS